MPGGDDDDIIIHKHTQNDPPPADGDLTMSRVHLSQAITNPSSIYRTQLVNWLNS